MLLNYLKLTVRLLGRNPLFSLINVACLSLGFGMFFILWQHSQSELQSDQYHEDFDRIVRGGVIWNWTDDGANWQNAKYGGLRAGGSHQFIEDFGDFEAALQVYNQGNITSDAFGHTNDLVISTINDSEKTRHIETKIAYADSNLFKFFTIPLVRGHSNTVLNGIGATVLSESIAQKYFGDSDPVGKTMFINDTIPLSVTGIFKDLPANTHLNFDLVISTQGLKLDNMNVFQLGHTYFKLRKGVDAVQLEAKLKHFSDVYFGPLERDTKGMLDVELFLQPLREIPYSVLTQDRFTAKSRHFLTTLSIVAIAILLMAWVNYVNMTVANIQKRFKELAARKAVGASSADYARQFIVESAFINVISFLAALTIVQLVRFPAATFFQFHIPEWTGISGSTWRTVFGVFLSGIIVTSLYPVLITFQASPKILFGSSRKLNRRNVVSKVLTTLQFAASIVLLAWVMSILLQLRFIYTKDIGLDRENIVVVDLPFTRDANFESSLNNFIRQAEALPQVVDVAASASIMGDFNVFGIDVKQRAESMSLSVDTNGGVDEKFIPFYDIKLLAGRNFIPGDPSNSKSIIISRHVTKRMGLTNAEDAVGLELEQPAGVRVIGVIEDYALRPLLSEYASNIHGIRGIALLYGNAAIDWLEQKKVSIKVKAGMTDTAPEVLAKTFNAAFPDAVFQWYYLDNHINQYYTGEKIFFQQILLFATVAIVIACLGLLGMISNKVVETTKEIGIRKVLGARLVEVAGLLLKTTARQVLVATLLGVPLSYYLVHQYLQRYSERVTLTWWYYLIPIFIMVTLMLLTISSVLVNAAKANPVESLRHE